jgi:transposase
MCDDRSFHVLEAIPSRLEVAPERPRRRWLVEAKMALIEKTLEHQSQKWAPVLRGKML